MNKIVIDNEIILQSIEGLRICCNEQIKRNYQEGLLEEPPKYFSGLDVILYACACLARDEFKKDMGELCEIGKKGERNHED